MPNAVRAGAVRRRAVPCALLAAAALSAAACGDPNDAVAQFNTVTYASAVFALSGTPLNAPTAINTPIAATVRAQSTYEFDVAFDFDAQGRAMMLTQRRVGLPLGGIGRQVALQTLEGPFDDIRAAPRAGWISDSLLTIAPGDIIGVRASVATCQFGLSPFIYSKMQVDSVKVAERRIWLTTLTDPNCGFRSLVPGRPEN